MSHSKKKVKIGFIHPDLGIGGAERLVLDVASALPKDKYIPEFITNHFDKSHAFDELKRGDFPVRVIGDWIPRSIFGKCQALCAYIRMIYLTLVYLVFTKKEDQHDVFFVDLIPIAIPFLALWGKRVIYYCHHPDLLASEPGGVLKQFYRKPINWLELKATGRADVILVNSEYTASVFHETFPEITKSIKVLYPTIALSFVLKVEQLKTCKSVRSLVPQINSDKKDTELYIFLSINRFHPAKNLKLAIYGMSKLREISSSSDWEKTFFIMAGGFDPQSIINAKCYENLITLTNKLELQNKIVFLKSPSDDLKTNLLKSCNCLVYTPIKEHFGIVPLEAMAVAKPVIACDSGGPRETIENGVTGYLCQPNEDSLAEVMVKLMKQDSEAMGSRGKKRLDEQFSYKSFVTRLNEIVNESLQ